jgi:glycosyltransferase involved in cell wall biosynthesis
MIHIAHVIETVELGGAEKLLLSVARNLNKGEFTMIVVHLSGGGALKGEFEKCGVRVFDLSLKRQGDMAGAVAALRTIFLENKIDIVHTHLFYANIYGRIAAKLAGVRHVLTTLHNPDYSYEDNGRITYKIRKAVDGYSGRLCNSGFLAVSGFVKADFEKNLGFKNIEVLHNAIESGLYGGLAAEERAHKRLELGAGSADILILNIGRLHPQKGQGYLLRAFHAIKQAGGAGALKLVIVGRGGMEDRLKNTARELGLTGQVLFLRDRTDIPALLQACDMFVLPSDYEGFGMALVEAMAAGLPVIASDIDTLREIVDDKVDGILVRKSDPGALADAILALIRDRDAMKVLGERARQKARLKFDITAYTGRLENKYRSMIREARNDVA